MPSPYLNNTAKCGAPLDGHGNRTFSEYRPQQDFNRYTDHNVSNNNQYRLFLQRNGQQIINQQRQSVYNTHKCNSCDSCGQCKLKH